MKSQNTSDSRDPSNPAITLWCQGRVLASLHLAWAWAELGIIPYSLVLHSQGAERLVSLLQIEIKEYTKINKE